MSAPAGPPPINLDLTLGALLVGTYISATLFGFSSLQTYSYFTNFPDDRKHLKLLVLVVWTLEFVHTIFVCRTQYEMSVTHFGTFGDFVHLPFVLKFSIVWSSSVACIVQSFFAYRVRIMSGRWELAICCWLLSSVRYAFSLATTVIDIQIGEQPEFDARFKWMIIIVLAVGAVNDILIAACLSFYLSRGRSGISSTDRVINRLITFTIESGLFTSIVATVMLICYIAMPKNFIWLAIFVFLAKTYSNSFLATLNARKLLRSGFGRDGQSVVVFNSENSGLITSQGSTARQTTTGGMSSILQSKSKHQPIAIEMSNVTTITSDDDYAKDNDKTDVHSAASSRRGHDRDYYAA